MLVRLRAEAFPPGTPLHAFFAWNEARLIRDRRFAIARDIYRLFARFNGTPAARNICVAHLAIRPIVLWRAGERIIVSTVRARQAELSVKEFRHSPEVAAARQVVERLLASVGSASAVAQAAVFQAFESLETHVDLAALASWRPRRRPAIPCAARRKILIVKLSALGDFVQALGPAAALREYHRPDRITLLTTTPYARFAEETGLFDEVVVARRSKARDIGEWLELRRWFRAGRFDRVYDLQTSGRSSLYAWLFLPGPMPQWSGIAWRCSHPHANRDRFPQHTIDKQAEQLLMAGIYPVPLPRLLSLGRPLPETLRHRSFVLLIPGSSPRHLRKRWPVEHYGELARRLSVAGYLPVIVGAPGEENLAAAVRSCCTEAIDLVGKTDLAALADLARRAALTIGNDTGAIHIAAAGGSPVVALFSDASDPSRCAPRGGPVRMLAEPDLAKLSVDAVLAAALELAGARAAARLEKSDFG